MQPSPPILQTLSRQTTPLPTRVRTDSDVNIITDDALANEILNWIAVNEPEFLAVDTETTPIIPGAIPDLVGISLYYWGPVVKTGFYFPFGHKPFIEGFTVHNLTKYIIEDFDRVLWQQRFPLIFHNAYFDLPVLERAGAPVEATVHDTMLYHWMLDENDRKSLEYLGRKYLGEAAVQNQDKVKKVAEKVDNDYSRLPVELLGPYAVEDVRLTAKLFELLWPKVEYEDLAHIAAQEIEFMHVLVAMKRRGIAVDLEKCRLMSQAASVRLAELRSELGFDPGKADQLAARLFLAPPKGLGLPLPPERSSRKSSSFPSGIPKMPKSVLEKLDHPIAALVLEYRGLVKARATWFNGFIENAGPDGKLRPVFKQGHTVTGRLSCANPNVQQIPRTSEEEREQGVARAQVKQLFLSSMPEEDELWHFDYSQAELRLAACYGRDEIMLKTFKEGGDLHQTTADRLGISRYAGKTLNFAILYGAGPEKLSELLDINQWEAEEILQGFWQAYPGMARAKIQATNAASSLGYIKLWNGRKRHFQSSSETHKAFNSAVQGGVGDIVKRSMMYLHGMDYKIVNQVHDDIWIEIPRAELDLHKERIIHTMQWPNTHPGFPVDFPVDGSKLS